MADKKIGDRYFRAGSARAIDAIKLQVRLMKMIGPGLAALPAIVAARTEDATEEQIASANAKGIEAITTIFANAEPDAVVDLIEEVFKMGKIAYDQKGNWDDIVVDQEFSGSNAGDLFPALIFILQETLGDFFRGALASGSHVIKKRA